MNDMIVVYLTCGLTFYLGWALSRKNLFKDAEPFMVIIAMVMTVILWPFYAILLAVK